MKDKRKRKRKRKQKQINQRRIAGAGSLPRLFLLLLLLQLGEVPKTAHALISCQTDTECVQTYRPGSECRDGTCTNPFQNGGCLHQALPGWEKLRVCHSEDPQDAAAQGLCQEPSEGLGYTEIRILGQNWESAFFSAWILQIVLSEILDVPVTLETGTAEDQLDFYHNDMPMDYGVGYDWDALRTGQQVGDCRIVRQENKDKDETNNSNSNSNTRELRQSEGPEYQSCAHVLPEVWGGRKQNWEELEGEAVIEAPQGMGALGQTSWFIPRFTGEENPTLLTYLGLQGEKNRRKLAETFLRPTSWKDYCDLVSSDGCQTPDKVAQRAPDDETEEARMFVDGVYTGHFRKTDENDCDKNPTNCTGHIVDFPCGWTSFVKQQTYWLDIALESNGPEPKSGGYSYGQMTEIWAAANATRSNVMMQWWTPEALYQQYLGTDAEFLRVALPPATQDCVEARVDASLRCEGNLEEQVGSTPLGSCDEPPHPLQRVVTENLYTMSYDPSIPEARQSPAYDTIKAFTLSGLQIGKIFEHWLEVDIDKWNYDPREAACRWVVDNFEDLAALAPRTYPRTVQVSEATHREPLFAISITAGVIATTLVLGCIYGTYKNQKKRVMVFAQVEFLWLLLAGLLMVALGSLMLPIPPTNGTCATVAWLVNLGYTLELVPLVVKVAAINRIMTAAARMKRVVLKHSTLFGIVFLLSMMVVIFMVFWTVLDPPQQSVDYRLTDQETDRGETIVMATHYCTSDSDTWMYMSLGWHTVLLVCATVLAFQTRRVQHDVNECQVLAILIYSHFVFVMLSVIVFMLEDLLQVSEITRYQSLVYSVDVIAACCIYFLPKFAAKEDPMAQRRPTFVSGHSSRQVGGGGGGGVENPLRPSALAAPSSQFLGASSHHTTRKTSTVAMAMQQAIQELGEDGLEPDSGNSAVDDSFAHTSNAENSRVESRTDCVTTDLSEALSSSYESDVEEPDLPNVAPEDAIVDQGCTATNTSMSPPPPPPSNATLLPEAILPSRDHGSTLAATENEKTVHEVNYFI